MSNDIGFRVSLETGEAESSAHNLARAFESLGQAMEKATMAGESGNAEKYGELMLKMRKQMLAEAKVGGDDENERRNPVIRTVLGVSRFLNRGQGYIGAAGSGNAAGAALGAAGDSMGLLGAIKGLPTGLLVGGAVVGGVVALAAGANKLSEQFEKVMKPSMDLAATLGMLGDNAKKNSVAFSEALNRSAEQAIRYGYSMEEGIQLATELGRKGLTKDQTWGAEDKVFRYQRATGADRGDLTETEALSKRYGLKGDSLALAYGGTLASGMQSGQFQEYLGATLRIFEEGLSRGVVKGFGEVTRTQNMLAAIGTTWKGELGAQRFQKMNDVVAGASDLNSDYDVIMYRAMQGVLKDEAGKQIAKSGKSTIDPSDYITVSKRLDRGLTPELMDKAMGIVESQLAGGDRTETILQTMKLFGLNATGAEEVYKAWKSGRLKDATAAAVEPKNAGSSEQKLLSETEQIKLDLANIGQNFIEYKGQALKFLEGILGGVAGSKMLEAYKAENAGVLDQYFVRDSDMRERGRVERIFTAAFNGKGQPDKDRNGIGDYGESAGRVQSAWQGLSPAQRLYIDTHPEAYGDLYSGLKDVKDFPDFEGTFKKRLGKAPGFDIPKKDYVKLLGLGPEFEGAFEGGDANAQALAGSLKDTWGSGITSFQASEMFGFLKSDLRSKGKDGFTGGEWKEVYQGYLDRYRRPGSASSPDTDPNRYMMDMFTNDFLTNRAVFSKSPGGKYQDAVTQLIMEYGNYLQYGAVKPLFDQARSRKTGDRDLQISETEYLAILRELVKQLADLNISIPKAVKDASEVEVVISGMGH